MTRPALVVRPMPGRVRRGVPWLLLALLAGLAVQLAPVLALPHVLSQDGPAHLDGAWVLLHHGDPTPLGAALRAHVDVDLSPVPNMLTTLLLAGLLTVLGPDGAERAVVVGFVLLLVGGLGYALRGVDRRAGWLAVAALPLAGAQLVGYGFWNFCWAVALSLLVLGVALRARRGWRAGPLVGFTLLLVATWSAHLLPWLVVGGVVAGLAGARALVERRSGRSWWTAVRRHALPPAVAALPSALLTVVYLHGATGPGRPADPPSWARTASLLSLVRPLVGRTWLEVPGALAVCGTLAVLVTHALRRRQGSVADRCPGARLARADRGVLLAAALGTGLAAALVPGRLGADFGFLPERLAWFPFLFLVLVAGSRPPSAPAARRLVAAVLVLAASGAVLARLPGQLADERATDEVLSVAGAIPARSTFLVVRLTDPARGPFPAGWTGDALQHVSGRLAVAARAVDVGHYEAVLPYFQVRATGSPPTRFLLDPGLDGLEQVPPRIDLAAAGDRVGTVVVLGAQRLPATGQAAQVLAHIGARYERVATSGATGLAEVWRLRR